MIIKVNNIDISSRLLSFKTLNEMNSDSLLIGNAVCKKLELKLDNHDGELTPLLDYPFFVNYNQNKKLGVFSVYEKPEKYTGELSLVLYDNMYFFNQRYTSKLNYAMNPTIKDQLDEMNKIIENQFGSKVDTRFILGKSYLNGGDILGDSIESASSFKIDYSNLDNSVLNKVVSWYDNTIYMRNYLGWIAELSGCNAFAYKDGNIVFTSLGSNLYTTIDVENYEKGEVVAFTRVCFDDGLLKLEVGNTVGNTLYLSSNNAYVDSDTDLSIISNKYLGMIFYSVRNVKMASIDNLCLTDFVNYNNEFIFMPLSISEVYSGGQYSIATISGEVNTVNQEIVINKIDPATRIRRIQTIVDQTKNSLSIIAQDVDENKENISLLQIDSESISGRVSSIEYGTDDLDGQLKDFKKTYETYTEQTSKKFVDVVKESKEYTDGELQDIKDVFVYFEKTTEGLVVRKESDNPDDLLVSTLVAPDSFQVRFNGVATTSIFQEGIDTSSLWLSKSLHLNPLSFTGYGSGEKGGVVIKWRGFD